MSYFSARLLAGEEYEIGTTAEIGVDKRRVAVTVTNVIKVDRPDGKTVTEYQIARTKDAVASCFFLNGSHTGLGCSQDDADIYSRYFLEVPLPYSAVAADENY